MGEGVGALRPKHHFPTLGKLVQHPRGMTCHTLLGPCPCLLTSSSLGLDPEEKEGHLFLGGHPVRKHH
jgi:hypothetical protein